MKLVGCSHDNGFNVRICEHLIVVQIGDVGMVDRSHLRNQVICQIADGVQFGITRLTTGLKMGSLRDRPCPYDPNVE